MPSSIAHVLSLEDKNDDTNSVLQQKIYVTYDTTDFTISGDKIIGFALPCI